MSPTPDKPALHRSRDPQQLFLDAARALVATGADAISRRGRFVIALSGGSTPKGLYQLLATPDFRQQLDWSRVEFFWGDERTVPPDHPDSNYRMAHEALLGPLGIATARVHRIVAEAEDVDAAARDYAAEIAGCFDVPADGPPPPFDLILLGMGDDGHTASLFPSTEALDETARWVVANRVPQHSTIRISMTYPLINSARNVHFLVSGEKKAAVLAQVLCGPRQPRRLPSQRIAPQAGRLEWFVDEAAAGSLPADV